MKSLKEFKALLNRIRHDTYVPRRAMIFGQEKLTYQGLRS